MKTKETIKRHWHWGSNLFLYLLAHKDNFPIFCEVIIDFSEKTYWYKSVIFWKKRDFLKICQLIRRERERESTSHSSSSYKYTHFSRLLSDSLLFFRKTSFLVPTWGDKKSYSTLYPSLSLSLSRSLFRHESVWVGEVSFFFLCVNLCSIKIRFAMICNLRSVWNHKLVILFLLWFNRFA